MQAKRRDHQIISLRGLDPGPSADLQLARYSQCTLPGGARLDERSPGGREARLLIPFRDLLYKRLWISDLAFSYHLLATVAVVDLFSLRWTAIFRRLASAKPAELPDVVGIPRSQVTCAYVPGMDTRPASQSNPS